MIQVRNLRVDYDDVCAVHDMSIDIGAGEICGLIGPNGAGKTSTLRGVLGLVEPTYGDVYINGIDIDLHSEEATRVVGFMPDSAPVYEDLTVWEFLDLFAASYLVPASVRPATIDYYLQLVDLTEKRSAMTAGLSRGMRQRLMLAKTLLPDPQVLLLDEPASGVDPYGRALLKDVMRHLGSQGKTILISSHILAELSEFCTSVCIMERGHIVTSGNVADVARQALGQAEISMEVVAGADSVEAILSAQSIVGPVRRQGDLFEFPVDGGAQEASTVLAALVSGGVGVASFSRKKEDLEAVFLKVGAKEVS